MASQVQEEAGNLPADSLPTTKVSGDCRWAAGAVKLFRARARKARRFRGGDMAVDAGAGVWVEATRGSGGVLVLGAAEAIRHFSRCIQTTNPYSTA